MKRNIDLTESRIFSNDIFRQFLKTEVARRFLGKPWEHRKIVVINSEDDLEHQKESIIALGNKTKRAEIRGYREMDSLDYCDCCGARMNLHPWDREIGVCHKCDYEMNKYNDKCLWRMKDEIRNSVIRIA